VSEDEEDRLDLDALFALHRLEPCLDEPSELLRTSNGGLRVRATAIDEACRERVTERLLGLGRPPVLNVDVGVVATASGPPEQSGGDVAELSPAYRALVDRFGAPSARALGRSALARSARALAEAEELERLTASWTPARLRALDVDRMTMWADVVRDHARRFRRESEQLREQLERLFATDPSGGPVMPLPSVLEIRTTDDVPASIARLAGLAASHDTAMRQMFDLSLTIPRVPVDVPAVARSVLAGERQAIGFDEPWSFEFSAMSAR
jgi:hypothetical protein